MRARRWRVRGAPVRRFPSRGPRPAIPVAVPDAGAFGPAGHGESAPAAPTAAPLRFYRKADGGAAVARSLADRRHRT
eukprot:3816725-Pyramimonas_sp.AAC.1